MIGTGAAVDVSIWGELLATRADARRFAGVVLDGGVRDVGGLVGLGRPTFAAAVSANDSRGRLRVDAFGAAVVCGGVLVEPGDVVMADLDGVVVIPARLVVQVARRARDKVAAEGRTRVALEAGESAADTYARFGVL